MPTLDLYAEASSDGAYLLYTFYPPGLLAWGRTRDEALATAFVEAGRLRGFLADCGQLDLLKEPWNEDDTPDLVIRETYARRGTVADGGTRATFQRDLEPVRPEEVPGFLAILRHLRTTFRTLKDRIPAGAYGFRSLPHRMTIEEQLRHVASCDRWYLSRFWRDLPRLPVSRDVRHKLVLNRELALERLGNMTREDLGAVKKTDRQVWTARKLFRRFMYHEKFHRDTIERDLALYLGGRP